MGNSSSHNTYKNESHNDITLNKKTSGETKSQKLGKNPNNIIIFEKNLKKQYLQKIN